MEDIRVADGRARNRLGESISLGDYQDELTIIENLTTRLAILHGEQEQLVNGAYFNSLTIPTLWRGMVQIIPGAGHAPHWEQPENFNALLKMNIVETAK